MTTYTIYWFPEQQTVMLENLPFLDVENAEWIPDQENGDHFALVQDLNENQHNDAMNECQADRIIGIKPGSNPGGSPNGCA